MRRLIGSLSLAFLGLAAPALAQETPSAPPVALPVATAPVPAVTAPAAPDPAAAVEPAPSTPPAADAAVVLDPKAPAKTQIDLTRRTQLGAGIGFSGPLGVGASLRLLNGLGADVKDDGTRVKAVCAAPMPHCAQGFLLQLDAGSGGGKLSLGVGVRAHVEDEGFRGTAAVALRVAVAHTWGNPIGTDPGLTYVGPEVDLSVLRIGLTLGTLFRVAGDRGAGVLFTWGLGFGL